MSLQKEIEKKQPNPSILWFAKDLPNICSLAGLFSALLALYFAFMSLFPAAMIALIWAVVFDWVDGMIARKMKGRIAQQSEFGGQLDSLIDIVSFGVCPAVVLLSYGNFSGWFIPGAFLIIAACALRLSYFNVYGLDGKSTYQGMACDNNAIILVFVFLFDGLLIPEQFSVLLYVSIITLALLNVASVRTPKLGGRWFYALLVYATGVSLFSGWQLLA